jgi:EpsI family protein
MAGTYSCDGVPVSVFAAAYLANVQGHELVSDANHLAPPEWRRVTTGEVREVAFSGGRSHEAVELELAFAGSRWLMWYWYMVGDEPETSGTAVKLKQAIRSLRDGRADGSIYVLETPLDSIESSRARLARVMEEVAKR